MKDNQYNQNLAEKKPSVRKAFFLYNHFLQI